jgi:hypothetical protein
MTWVRSLGRHLVLGFMWIINERLKLGTECRIRYSSETLYKLVLYFLCYENGDNARLLGCICQV